MSLKPYPAYKDSGVAWLGDVPEHWEVTKFRHTFQESPEKIENEIVGRMLSVSGYRGIEIKEYDDENRRRLDKELVGYRIVRRGQLVVNTMWLNYAGLGVSEHEGHVSPAYRSYWINCGFNHRFVHHMMRSGNFVLGYTSFLTGIRPNSLQMSRDDLMSFQLLKPSIGEQTAIAAFLDRETGKIDALIAEQEKLIALLAEKRQATISHAVTKGLNPDAPLKDSGVEWLGQIPAHWEVKPLKAVASLNPSKSEISALAKETELSFLPMEAIGEAGLLDLTRKRPISEVETGYSYFANGDVVFAKVTPCFENGKGAIMRGLYKGHGFGTTELTVLRPRHDGAVDFLWWLISSSVFRRVAVREMTGAGGLKRVPDNFVAGFKIGWPPRTERTEIDAFIASEVAKFNELSTEANRVIDLLKERRTALISAAVTGKIDVRGLVSDAVAA